MAVALIRRKDARTYATDIFGETHYKFLTYRVDGRIGDLCELLAEIVEEDLWLVGNNSQRSVITHSCHWLLTLSTHRDDRTVDVLLAKAETHQLAFEVLDTVDNLSSALEVLELDAVGREPLAIRMLSSKFCLDLTIIVDLAFLRIDEQDLSWLQSTLAHYLAWIEIHHANLARHNHHATLGDGVARWAKTIAVEHTTCETSVAEHQCSRTIPWLHED